MKYIQYLNVNILKMKILTNFIIFKNIILFLFNIIKKNPIYIVLFGIFNNKSRVVKWCPSLLTKLEVPHLQNPLVAFVKFFSLILSH